MAKKSETPAPRGRKPADPNETKAQAFSRLASNRTGKALAMLDNIGSLANPSNYEYTKDQADKIVSALQDKVNQIKASFANPAARKVQGGFSV